MSGQHKFTVGIFDNRPDAEQVFNRLKLAGVAIPHISIIPMDSRNTECREEVSEDEAPEENSAIAATIVGMLLGAVGGCLGGLGLLLVPEAGFVLAVGSWGLPLLTTVTGAGIGAASFGLIRSFAGLKTSEDGTDFDEQGRWNREYLVVVEGTDNEIYQAESIIFGTQH